jgi:hypothetical protein
MAEINPPLRTLKNNHLQALRMVGVFTPTCTSAIAVGYAFLVSRTLLAINNNRHPPNNGIVEPK